MMNTGLLKKHLKGHYVFHEHGLPHGLCPYPCHYMNYQMPSYMDSLNLSDILDYEDYMITPSNEDIPGMEEVQY